MVHYLGWLGRLLFFIMDNNGHFLFQLFLPHIGHSSLHVAFCPSVRLHFIFLFWRWWGMELAPFDLLTCSILPICIGPMVHFSLVLSTVVVIFVVYKSQLNLSSLVKYFSAVCSSVSSLVSLHTAWYEVYSFSTFSHGTWINSSIGSLYLSNLYTPSFV